MRYFSDPQIDPEQPGTNAFSEIAWGGLVAYVKGLSTNGAFGQHYPIECPDGRGPYGNDEEQFLAALRAEVPDVPWPLSSDAVPSTTAALDFLQFIYDNVAKPIQGSWHGFFQHYHLSFDVEAGRDEFRQKVNRILSRNQLPYQLAETGEVEKLLSRPGIDPPEATIRATEIAPRTDTSHPEGRIPKGQPDRWDVFVSHASEDKETVARPLAELLRNAGLRVWLDENELFIGDSLRDKIDKGLSGSRFGVVILSEAFFSKHWPQQELDALAAREVNGGKVILPIWHGVDQQRVANHSPTLAGRLAAETSKGLDYIVAEINKVAIQTPPT